jgi:hypothetical protein
MSLKMSDQEMTFTVKLDRYCFEQMQKNKYGHHDVLTHDYMLDILHDIVDQMHEQEDIRKHLGHR